MTIAIDCRFAAGATGLGRYTRELVIHLLRRNDPFRYVLIVSPEGVKWAGNLPGHPRIVVAQSRHYSLAEQLEIPRLLKAEKVDVYFALHFNVPLHCPVPFVVTIHDLILHRYPNQASFLRQKAYQLLIGQAVKKARRIVAVSNFTASEILSVYGDALRPKLSVIYEGVSPVFHPRSKDEQEQVMRIYDIRRPFFLYVGNAKQHKNVQLLVDAFAELRDPGAQLVLLTSGKEAEGLRLREGVRLLPAIIDNHLAALYSAASAFVTASLYEGFCLPVAEAAACGCPVIATNRGALPEVAPSASMFLSPTVSGFSAAMQSPPVAPSMPRRFSWEDTAAETASVLLGALS